MIYEVYRVVGIIGMLIGAFLGFALARRFTWFGTFRGIVGQFITFMVVGAILGGTILSAPIYKLFGDQIDNAQEQEKKAEDDYSDDDEYSDSEQEDIQSKAEEKDEDKEDTVTGQKNDDNTLVQATKEVSSKIVNNKKINPYDYIEFFFINPGSGLDRGNQVERHILWNIEGGLDEDVVGKLLMTQPVGYGASTPVKEGENVVREIQKSCKDYAEENGYTYTDTILRAPVKNSQITDAGQIPDSFWEEVKKTKINSKLYGHSFGYKKALLEFGENGILYSVHLLLEGNKKTADQPQLQPGDVGYEEANKVETEYIYISIGKRKEGPWIVLDQDKELRILDDSDILSDCLMCDEYIKKNAKKLLNDAGDVDSEEDFEQRMKELVDQNVIRGVLQTPEGDIFHSKESMDNRSQKDSGYDPNSNGINTVDDIDSSSMERGKIDKSRIVSVVASSELVENGKTHSAKNMIDGTLDNAWVEGVDGFGEGERITFTFDGIYQINGFHINPGYQKSEDLYYKNARPKEIEVTFKNGYSETFYLEDTLSLQNCCFKEAQDDREMTLAIKSVYPGSAYQDTVISEIDLY